MKCPLEGRRFYCREWVFTKLRHYLEARKLDKSTTAGHSGGVLITGGPGTGKTALCCELTWPTVVISAQAELNARLAAVHFCQRFDATSLEMASFIRSLVEQLSSCPMMPKAYRQKCRADPAIQQWLELSRCLLFPKEAMLHAIVEPLRSVAAPAEPLMIVVDSLHETITNSPATPDQECSFSNLLAEMATLLPRWLLLICTARRGCRPVMQSLAGFRKITLDDLRKSTIVRDIQQYILTRLDVEENLRQQLDLETAEILNQLHIKSAGCLLYLELVLDGVRDGFIRLREVQHIPGTLNGMYLWLCQRLFSRGHLFDRVKPILDILLAVRTPLSLGELYEASRCRDVKMTFNTFTELMGCLRRMLQEFATNATTNSDSGTLMENINNKILIFHPSFEEWLLDVKYCTRKYLCDPSEGHGTLALAYASRGASLSPEEIVTLAYHLSRSPSRPPFNYEHLASFLLQSAAPVQELVLDCPVIDEATTRLLLEAGADFVNLNQSQIEGDTENGKRKNGQESPESLRSSSDRSENEVLADESYLDSEGRSLMHLLAMEGNDKHINQLLSRGAYCDPEDNHGDTPLNLAAKHGHTDVVGHLVQAGADVNHIGNDAWLPLRSAAWGGHFDTVQLLLNKGALIDLTAGDQRTALRAAAWSGHDEVVLLLLRYGAQIDMIDNEGRTALMVAAYMAHKEIVERLLEAAADPNKTDNDGRTALALTTVSVATKDGSGHLAVAQALLKGGAYVNCTDKTGRTPLFSAALEGYQSMCSLLLQFGADIDQSDERQNSPLSAAAASGHSDLVIHLLDNRADQDTIDAEGRTVLTIAAAHGNNQVVSVLLDRGLDEMHRDNNGWLSLHHAAFEGRADVCRLLCQCNSLSVHETDREGRHPLILAAEEGHVDAARILLDFGAPIDRTTLDGKSPLRCAASLGHKQICHLLFSHGADLELKDLDGNTVLFSLILERQLESAELMLKFGCRFNVTDSQGRTPLHVAAWQGELGMAELLLRYGADINAGDNDGRTALMTALWQNNLNIVRFVLQRRADPNAVCLQEATALSIAAQEGHEEAVRLLLRHGANPHHKDVYSRSPKDVALKAGHNKIVALLAQCQTLSPVPLRRCTPISPGTSTGHSGGSSSAEKTSGFASLGMSSSTDSPITNIFDQSPHKAVAMFSTHSSYKSNHSSNKSTLSSTCGSPECDDFARQLLQRSLPRPHSGLFNPPKLYLHQNSQIVEEQSPIKTLNEPRTFGLTRTASVPAERRRRPGIATNPKCRKPKCKESIRSSSSLTEGEKIRQMVRSSTDDQMHHNQQMENIPPSPASFSQLERIGVGGSGYN